MAIARRNTLLALSLLIVVTATHAQRVPGYNYDESKIPPYTLLDPLRLADGRIVTTSQQWFTQRRPQILRLFEENIFGHTPDAAKNAITHARIIEHNEHALNGLAVREQVELTFDPAPGVTPSPQAERTLRLLIYIPAAAAAAHHPVPVVLGLNFLGNQTVLDDPAIQPTPIWIQPKGSAELQHIAPSDESRGRATDQWQVRMLLSRGYGFATAYYGDLEPDFKNASQYSARNLFGPIDNAPDAWGAIGLWAWGLSRALDYLVLDAYVDPATSPSSATAASAKPPTGPPRRTRASPPCSPTRAATAANPSNAAPSAKPSRISSTPSPTGSAPTTPSGSVTTPKSPPTATSCSHSSRRARSTSAPPSATNGPTPRVNFSPPSAPRASTNSSANPRSRPTHHSPHSTTPSASTDSSPITSAPANTTSPPSTGSTTSTSSTTAGASPISHHPQQ